MAGQKIRLLYVCDFSSIHARTLISRFAAKPERYDVIVASTAPAVEMDNVKLVPLTDENDGRAVRAEIAIRLAYQVSLALPRLFTHLRGRELMRQGRVQGERLVAGMSGLEPDVIHVLRTQPEGLVALPYLSHSPVPMLLSTWGQDFVLWARSGRAMARATRNVVARAAFAFPDNARDARLLVTEYDLPAEACSVMPVTGGIARNEFDEAETRTCLKLAGEPSLLSMRGWENAYIRIEVLVQAMRLFVRSHPRAHLYINGATSHPGRRTAEKWVQRYGMKDHVSLIQLPRPELLDAMRGTDLSVSATISDGLPISLLEALWFGQVPVVSDLESIRPPLKPGQNGIVFNRLNPETIADAWERALPLVPLREHRQRDNRRQLATTFDLQSNLERIARAYRRLAS